VSALTLGLAGALAMAPGASASVATAQRVYEQVTPNEKRGSDVQFGIRASADGNAIAFSSLAALDGTPAANVFIYYAAHRSDSGWTTEALVAPNASEAPNLNDTFPPNDLSDDLHTAYYTVPGYSSLSTDDRNNVGDAFLVTGGAATWLTPGLTLPETSGADAAYAGRSSDGRHVVLETAKQLMPGVPGGVKRVYEKVDGALRVVSVLPDGTTATTPASFGGDRTTVSQYSPADARAISEDGSKIYFETDDQLYVRLNGTTTELISASEQAGHEGDAIADADATFMAASSDGTKVFFTSALPLVDDTDPATNAAGGLYRYDLTDHRLTELVPLAAGETIAGVSRTAPDGSRIYFATDATLGASGASTSTGTRNLFTLGADGLQLVAVLQDGLDGEAYKNGEFRNQAEISPDGKRFAFQSSRSLGTADNGGRTQVYVYDAGTSRLTCVSCPPSGHATQDGALRDVPDAAQTQPRGFTDDGTFYFESPDPLTADDTDTAFDVYAYDAAGLHVASPGTATDAHLADVSADGRDVFIKTHDKLASTDVDNGYADIYDARIGGGFPAVEPPVVCSGEACRGPQSVEPPAPNLPASLGTQDTSAPAADDTKAPTFTLGRISSTARAKWARTGKLTLSVKVSDSAVLSAKATARLRGAKKASTVASASAGREAKGTVKLSLTLSSKAKASLKRSGKLTVKLAVSCSDTKTVKHATVVLRKTKTTKKAAR
jgi:hypothetical protein